LTNLKTTVSNFTQTKNNNKRRQVLLVICTFPESQSLFYCKLPEKPTSSALAASPDYKRLCLFDTPLFVAPKPPPDHPVSTASIGWLKKQTLFQSATGGRK
jgi:hypothetical protein